MMHSGSHSHHGQSGLLAWRRRLHYLAAAFGPGQGTFEGTHYALDADSNPSPTGLRTVVGGSGAVKTPTLAGRFADEYNHFTAAPETIAPKIQVMRQAAEEAGETLEQSRYP